MERRSIVALLAWLSLVLCAIGGCTFDRQAGDGEPAAALGGSGGGPLLVQRPARAEEGGLGFELPRIDPGWGPRSDERRTAPYEFYFSRAAYRGPMLRGFASWSVDYPKADVQFVIGLKRLVPHLDAYDYENPLLLDDPDLSRFPFLYAVEVGFMTLSDAEARGLRRYLLAGGFLVIDDFWGSREWRNLAIEIERVLPEYPIVEVPIDHPIFHCFYDVNEVVQVPNVGQGRAGGPTWERDGFVPRVRGIFDDRDRLMVIINWNSDLGDAWEWAEDPYYPLRFSTYAYQMGVNFIVYAMSH